MFCIIRVAPMITVTKPSANHYSKFQSMKFKTGNIEFVCKYCM